MAEMWVGTSSTKPEVATPSRADLMVHVGMPRKKAAPKPQLKRGGGIRITP
jgi:hypothetical protein